MSNDRNNDDGGKLSEIPNVLACDVGNCAVHFAHVCGDDVGDVQVMPVGSLAGLGQALAEMWNDIPEPRQLVACSVNPTALKALEAAADASLGQAVLVVGRDLPLPMPTDVADPKAVGTDRLCAAVAAFDRLGTACVVADFGTAITVDCVSGEGVFLGGAILPGLSMSVTALHDKTAQLPQVELRQADWVFGKDTSQAIVGGVLAAAAGALRELVEAYATELGQWPTVIVTGGDAELIRGRTIEGEIIQAVVPDLTIRGAALAYYNSLLGKP
jgi:type III pantothenate kinase